MYHVKYWFSRHVLFSSSSLSFSCDYVLRMYTCLIQQLENADQADLTQASGPQVSPRPCPRHFVSEIELL